MEHARRARVARRGRHRRLVTAVLFALATAAIATAPHASAAEGVAVDGPDPIVLGPAGVDVVVRNDGPTGVSLLVRGGPLKDASRREAARLMVVGDDAVAQAQIRLTLGPARSRSVNLTVERWDGTTPLTGALEVVKVSGKERTVETRRPVRVDGGADIPSGVTTWRATSYQGALLVGPRTYHTRLPLVRGRTCPTDSASTALLSTGSETVQATLTCDRGGGYATLTFEDFPAVGSYTGKLVSSSGPLEVSVQRSTIWIAPTVLALLGLVLAGLRSWWVDRRRNLVRYEERVDAVVRLAGRSHDVFDEAAKGKSWASYDVRRPVLAWSQSWYQRLRDPDVDEDVFKELRTDAGRLAGLLARWQSAPAAFETLPSTPQDVPAEVIDYLPGLEGTVMRIAAGGAPIATVEELAQILEDTAGYARAVVPAARRLARHNELVLDPPDYQNPIDQDVLDKAIQRIRAVLAEAQTVQHIDELDEIVDELDGIDAELRKLPERPRVVAEAMSGAEVAQPDGQNEDEFEAALSRAYSRRAGRISADMASFALAAAVAVFTALSQLYVGKAWGTWLDQVAMVFWAFGATVLLNDVLQGLLRLIERQSTGGA